MLGEEGREIQQPEDSFYGRAEKTLLTCPVFVVISVRTCYFPVVRLRCHDLIGYGFGGRRRPKSDSCCLLKIEFERGRRQLPSEVGM